MTMTDQGFDTEPLLTPRQIDSTGVSVFPIGFDACVLGWVTGPERAREVLDLFGKLGGNLVSTADHYAGGRSEFMIGEWLRTVDRDSVVIATKAGRHPDSPGLTREAIRASVTASLERLRTDYVDFLSFDGDLLPPDPREAFDAVAELIAEGRIRYLSAAHFGADRLRELQELASASGLPPFRAALTEYSLMRRTRFETEMGPVGAELGLGMLARLPLAAGFLSGEVRSRADLPANPMFEAALEHVGRRGFRVLEVLEAIATARGTTTTSVALAWLLGRPGVTAALVRINDLDSLFDSLAGASFWLTRQESLLIDDASS